MGAQDRKDRNCRKLLTPLFVQRDAVPAAALSESGACNVSAERDTKLLKSNKLSKASYFSTAGALLVPGRSMCTLG